MFKYRQDIEVMRAVAVLLVVIFHVDENWLPGGFIGVDVFFVISGYLITQNLIAQKSSGDFSYRQFYTRRVRRLFPAAFVTIFITFLLGVRWFSPEHLESLSEAVIYSLVSASNILFWRSAGYFDSSAEFNPLLHMWSLSVEEQFYLFWPLVILGALLLKNNARELLFFLAITFLALAYSEHALSKDASAAFFLTPFRIQEFSIGALCIWLRRLTNNLFPRANFLIPTVYLSGFVTIILSAIIFSQKTRFPGLNGILPCLGAAMMICTGDKVGFSCIVKNRFMVGIGLISYSLYLVHWPLIIFYKYHNLGGLSLYEKILLMVVSLICAVLLYNLVEKPFRPKGTEKNKSAAIAFSCALSIALLSAPAAYAYINKGWEWRVPGMLRNVLDDSRAAKKASIAATKLTCSLDEGIKPVDWWASCLSQKFNNNGGYLVIGDSHGRDTWQVLRLVYPNENIQMLYQSFCLPFEYSRDGRSGCFIGIDQFIRKYLVGLRVKGVLLSSHFATNKDIKVEKTINAIKALDIPVALFGPTINFNEHIPKIALNHGRMAGLEDKVNSLQVMGVYPKEKILSKMAKSLDVPFISKLDILCPDERCVVIIPEGNTLLSFDNAHWTPKAQQFVAGKLKAKYSNIAMLFKG